MSIKHLNSSRENDFSTISLSMGVDRALRDPESLVLQACGRECLLVDLLLQHQADPGQLSNSETLLTKAVTQKLSHLVKQLLKERADPNQILPGSSLLHRAIQTGYSDAVPLLLEAGASPYVLERDKITPLELVYRSGEEHLPVYASLVEKDRGFTKHLRELNLLGQRFDLKEPVYGGSFSIQTCLSFAETINHCPDDWGPLDWKKSRDLLLQSLQFTADEGVEAWRKKEVLFGAFGWENHDVAALFFDNVFALGNTGFRSAPNPGINFYAIGRPEKVPEVIQRLSRLKSSPEEFDLPKDRILQSDEFFRTVTLLELEQIGYVYEPFQEARNCCFVAAKLAFRAILIFLDCQRQLSLSNSATVLRKIFASKAIDSHAFLYSLVVQKDKELALHQLLALVEKDPRMEPFVSFPTLADKLLVMIKQRSDKSLFKTAWAEEEAASYEHLKQMLAQKVPSKFIPQRESFCAIC